MLKAIRRSRRFNLLVRIIIRFFERAIISISNRWRVSGEVAIEIGETSVIMYSDCDDPIVDCLYYKRGYNEISDLRLFSCLAREAKMTFDVGAFTGLYSLVTAKSNGQCNVIAFEPNPVNFKRLVRNKEANRLQNIKCFPLAVGADSKLIDFFCSTDQQITDTSSAELAFSEETYGGRMKWTSQKVQQVSIDDFVATQKLDRVDLMKIDTEHYELNVFRGMLQTIKKFRPVILCEIFLNDERRDFFNSLASMHGYFIYGVIKEGVIRMDNGISPTHDGLNFLFATGKTHQVYSSFRQIDLLTQELLNKKV